MPLEDIEEILEEVAAKPELVRSGGHEVKQQPLRDLIALAKHLSDEEEVVITRPGAGIRFQKITPVYE